MCNSSVNRQPIRGLFEALISRGRKKLRGRPRDYYTRPDKFSSISSTDLFIISPLPLSFSPFFFLLYGTRLFFPSVGVIGYFSSSWEATIIIALRHPCSVLHTYPSRPRVKGESVLNTVNFVAELFGSRYALLSPRRDREREKERRNERREYNCNGNTIVLMHACTPCTNNSPFPGGKLFPRFSISLFPAAVHRRAISFLLLPLPLRFVIKLDNPTIS